MKITIQTFAYNEEFLMPLFLKHYDFADRIYVIVDADTNDKTREILASNPKVVIEDFKFPDMLDDDIKRIKNCQVSQQLGKDTDWLFVVDVDEFIFPASGEDIRHFLARQIGNVIIARMWQVYRHVSDVDLDISKPVVYQRCHGDPNRETGIQALYCKPIILRTPLNFILEVGNHHITGQDLQFSKETLDGAHWANADQCFAVKRRLAKKSRYSNRNIEMRWGYHEFTITEESVYQECKAHLNDPKLF